LGRRAGGTNRATQNGMALVNHQEIYLAVFLCIMCPFKILTFFDSNPTNYYTFYLAKFAADTSAAVTLWFSTNDCRRNPTFQFSVAGVPGSNMPSKLRPIL